jgi:hypothetical protein
VSSPDGFLLVVREDSDQLRALADECPTAFFRFKRLPFVAVRPDESILSGPPPEVTEVLPISSDTYNLLWAINRMLLEASDLSWTWAPNGNRWAIEWDGANGLDGFPVTVPREAPRQVPSFVAGFAFGVPVLDSSTVAWTRIANPAAMHLSLQSAFLEWGDLKALDLATRVASRQMPVVVAAGNWGRGRRSRLSPLARLPCTISVAALADEVGTRLDPTSSVGLAGVDGPTIAAFGENIYASGTFGTSFAVPRVARQLATLATFAAELSEAVNRSVGRPIAGVPLPALFGIDYGFLEYDPKPPEALPMLPFCAVDPAALERVSSILRDHGLTAQYLFGSETVVRMLLASARPTRFGRHEVGYGVVSDDTTAQYLKEFTGADLIETCHVSSRELDISWRSELNRIRIAVQSEVESLQRRAWTASLTFSIELETSQVFGSMRSPDITPGATLYHLEPSGYRWPPPLQD